MWVLEITTNNWEVREVYMAFEIVYIGYHGIMSTAEIWGDSVQSTYNILIKYNWYDLDLLCMWCLQKSCKSVNRSVIYGKKEHRQRANLFLYHCLFQLTNVYSITDIYIWYISDKLSQKLYSNTNLFFPRYYRFLPKIFFKKLSIKPDFSRAVNHRSAKLQTGGQKTVKLWWTDLSLFFCDLVKAFTA